MNLLALIGLLFDGAQVLTESIKIILILSVHIIGIGVLTVWGISASRANGEWHNHWVASLSLGLCGFVLLSYAIVAISRIWYWALPILPNGLLILSFLACAIGLLISIKKKHHSVDLETSSPRWLSLH